MAKRSGSRYLRILRGSDETARNRLIQYFKGEIKPTYPERQVDRPDREVVWVVPFGLPLTAGAKVAQNATSTGLSTAIAFANGFVSNTAPAADKRVVVRGLLTPRAAITTGRSGSGTADVSKISGKRYKKYGGKTISLPFGEGTAATEKSENEVFQKIFAAVKESNARNLCTFVPGSYGVA